MQTLPCSILRSSFLTILAAMLAAAGLARAQQASEPAPVTAAAETPLISGGDGLRELGERVKVSRGTLNFQAGATLVNVPADTAAEIEIGGPFNAEGFTRLVFDLKNEGAAEVKYQIRLENPGATDTAKSVVFYGWITPGQAKQGNVYFPRPKGVLKQYPELKVFLPMKGLPGGLLFEERNIDPGQIEKIKIAIFPCAQEVRLSLGAVRASHPPVPALLAKNEFFPFIDTYGQFIHETWPGKVTRDEDLKEAARQEETDLAEHPGPQARSQFGGWAGGPKLKATGFFRTEKYEGKWWLVDPEGCLFWSNGVTCVGAGGADTAVTGRESFFASLPDAASPLAQFYAKGGSLYMFTQANLYRKYGSDWLEKHRDITQRRLKSWGLNTLGNWSNPMMTSVRQLPYVVPVEFKCATVTGRKFPDVFSPSFQQGLREAFESKTDSFNDPWCIGYFVQNELKFGGPVRFMEEVSMESEKSACKAEWVKDLKGAYSSISKFNEAAGTRFTSWNALLANRKEVKLNGVSDAATAFYTKMCTVYFETCRDEQKRVAPHQMYLGSRFLQNVSEVPMKVAAQFCDVVSFNVYEYTIAERSVAGLDKPFIVGEFHFGSLDRGMFGPGCRWAGDQQDRAGLYKDYVTGGLKNPNCVGAHWFQYNSQAFTGRPDGENFQVGLLDITGNPYPELRDAMREVSYGMYETRLNAK